MPIEHYHTTGFVSEKAARLLKISSKFPPEEALGRLETTILLQMLDDCAAIAGGLRTSIHNPDPAYVRHRSRAERIAIMERGNITIGFSKDGYLRVLTPPLLTLSNRRAMQIAFAVEDALAAFIGAGNQLPQLDTFLIVYKRFSPDIDSENLCDNDNMECRKITNVLVRAMKRTDNPRSASFLYTTVQCDSPCTEITVYPRSSLDNAMAYIELTQPEGLSDMAR